MTGSTPGGSVDIETIGQWLRRMGPEDNLAAALAEVRLSLLVIECDVNVRDVSLSIIQKANFSISLGWVRIGSNPFGPVQ
jgi:hypothetical protein